MEGDVLTQETTVTESHVISEYEQTVLTRLDEIVSIESYQYSLGLFLTGTLAGLFVCVLLYKFLLRAFY